MNIEELKRLAEAATPGPWSSHPNGYYGVHSNTGTICSTGEKIADALYIAAANPAAILELIQQRDELLAHIPEWHCKTCNTIHLPPNGFNLCCPTPKCTGLLKPSSQAIRIVEAQRDELLAALKALDRGCRDPRCIGVLHGLDLARTAIAKAEG